MLQTRHRFIEQIWGACQIQHHVNAIATGSVIIRQFTDRTEAIALVKRDGFGVALFHFKVDAFDAAGRQLCDWSEGAVRACLAAIRVEQVQAALDELLLAPA